MFDFCPIHTIYIGKSLLYTDSVRFMIVFRRRQSLRAVVRFSSFDTFFSFELQLSMDTGLNLLILLANILKKFIKIRNTESEWAIFLISKIPAILNNPFHIQCSDKACGRGDI